MKCVCGGEFEICCSNEEVRCDKCFSELTAPDVLKLAETELSLIKSRLQGITIEQLKRIAKSRYFITTSTLDEVLTEIHKLISEVSK